MGHMHQKHDAARAQQGIRVAHGLIAHLGKIRRRQHPVEVCRERFQRSLVTGTTSTFIGAYRSKARDTDMWKSRSSPCR